MSRVVLCVPAGLGSAASFGVSELTKALQDRGHELVEQVGEVEVILARTGDPVPCGGLPSPADTPEAYAIARPAAGRVAVVGSDESGLLYGCLDLAEQLNLGCELEAVAERRAQPELAVRSVHNFLHSEEAERGWINDLAFWQGYADALARDRFNRFNLIYGLQTPYLIPIYAFMLDDLDARYPGIKVEGITPEERARNLRVLQMASSAMASRGLRFFLGVWESRPWTTRGGERANHPTRVSGTDDMGQLTAYTRDGFAHLMALLPDVGGIQLRMNVESGVADQRFFVDAYVPVLKELAQQGRRLGVELRSWGLLPETLQAFRSTGLEVVVSCKYYAEHQAMPYQPVVMRGSYSYDSFLRKDRPYPLQWHLWNLGSHRLFNWGDPDYARRFVQSCHLGDGVGFDLTPPGSQKGYSEWGQVSPGDWQPRTDLPVRWDFERYWFFLQAFGRMAYDPTTGDEAFLAQLADRTGGSAAPVMLAAYRVASKVVSYLISQRMDDPNMYVWPELDAGGPIDHNTIAPPGEGTLFATAREYAEDLLAARGSAKLSPFDCARDLDGYADGIEAELARLAELPGLEDNLECRTTRVDFAALAALARYHAAKSRATGDLALFYATGERRYLDAAEVEAEAGAALWDELCERTETYHDKLHFGPSGGHWRDNKPRVAYDLRRIRRVRELFDDYGLLSRGFDFGPSWTHKVPPRAWTGLEPEPRFEAVNEATPYTEERGYGWLRPSGIRSTGFALIMQDILWGVHYIKPDGEYDLTAVERVPLDGLTHRYQTGDEPRVFRVDLPDGEYEVTFIAPAVAGLTTPVSLPSATVELGGATRDVARVTVTVKGDPLEVTVGGKGTWALAGLIIRRCAPEIAHLPALALRAEQDVEITASATAPAGVRGMRLLYLTGTEWRERPMAGDGVAFRAVVPAGELAGEVLECELVAEDAQGHVTTCEYSAPIVRGFQAPRIVSVEGPHSWATGRRLTLGLALENGEYAREVRLHYREADQNRDMRMAVLPGGHYRRYTFEVDTEYLDDAYELIYYFEVVDVLGRGSFYPDPFTDARYLICRPA